MSGVAGIFQSITSSLTKGHSSSPSPSIETENRSTNSTPTVSTPTNSTEESGGGGSGGGIRNRTASNFRDLRINASSRSDKGWFFFTSIIIYPIKYHVNIIKYSRIGKKTKLIFITP